MWQTNCFFDLVGNYPQGSRSGVVERFDFVDTTLTHPQSCALRLSYALEATLPNSMAGFTGNTWTTSSGICLARGSRALANYIRRESGWSVRHHLPNSGESFTWSDYPLPEGQGIAFWNCSVGVNHIDLWDRNGHLAAAYGRVMLWRPPPENVKKILYWQLDPPSGMVFGLHELGETIDDNL